MARNPSDEELLEIGAVVAPTYDDPLPLQRLQSCGLPLASSVPMDRWREEAELRERQRKAAREEMRANEKRAVDDANQAMANAWAKAHRRDGFSDQEHEILGRVIATERALWRAEVDLLRKDLNDLIAHVRAVEPRSG